MLSLVVGQRNLDVIPVNMVEVKIIIITLKKFNFENRQAFAACVSSKRTYSSSKKSTFC